MQDITRVIAIGLTCGLKLNVVLLLIFRLLGFGWNGARIPLQSYCCGVLLVSAAFCIVLKAV